MLFVGDTPEAQRAMQLPLLARASMRVVSCTNLTLHALGLDNSCRRPEHFRSLCNEKTRPPRPPVVQEIHQK